MGQASKIIFVISFFWTMIINAQGQTTNTFIHKYYHIDHYFGLSDPIQSKDKGFLMFGNKLDTSSSVYSMLILKTDSSGGQVWSKSYLSGNTMYPAAYTIDFEDNIIMIGSSLSFPDDSSFGVVKTDSAGNLLWSVSLSDTNSIFEPKAICMDNDSGFVIAANHSFNGSGNPGDLFVAKLDHSGNRIWSHYVQSAFGPYVRKIKRTIDNGFILTGEFGFPYSMMVMKLDSLGNVEWSRSYDDTIEDWAFDITQCQDSGYIFVGQTWDGDHCTIVKIDVNGNPEWAGNLQYNSQFFPSSCRVESGNDGYYYICGNLPDTTGLNNIAFLMKLDLQGAIQWAGKFIHPLNVYSNGFTILQDGSFVIGGTNEFFAPPNFMQLSKTGALNSLSCEFEEILLQLQPLSLTIDSGATISMAADSIWSTPCTISNESFNDTLSCSIILSTPQQLKTEDEFYVFPNPAESKVTFRFANEYSSGYQIRIFDALGQLVLTRNGAGEQYDIDVSGLPNGIYYSLINIDNLKYQSRTLVIFRN